VTRRIAPVMIGLMALGALAEQGGAADIRVLTAGAMRGVLAELLPPFEKDTGHKVSLDNATAGALAKRIEDGEAFDVAIIPPKVVEGLIEKGRILPDGRIDVAKVGIGVAVKEGAPLPNIETVDAFKRTLLAARFVAYIDPRAGGSSGLYFDALLDRLGIGGEVRPKAKLKQGGYVAELVASGEAEVAVHQMSEIVPVKGVVLVGPLPPEIQSFTVYSAAIGAAAKEPKAGRLLIDRIAGPAAAPVLKAKGMDKP
jgi:molybdate transport system substrate-binding protein